MPKGERLASRQDELREFQSNIGLTFGDIGRLDQALTHSSYVNEFPDHDAADNQRLEFLGDAILDFLVGEWLYERYPDAREGELTSLRAHVVRTEGLALFAQEIALGRHLRLGRGEASGGGGERPANLCAAFEALTGALYLDQGLEAARRWVREILERHSDEIEAHRSRKDAKSRLQEYTQASLRVTPSYRIIAEKGPDHAKAFTAQVLVDGNVWGQGSGNNKQAAEQMAAHQALTQEQERD